MSIPKVEGMGYESWYYVSPASHYTIPNDAVTTDLWSGGKGHPLCGPKSYYFPISEYGPLCCPILNVNLKPYTYNCGSNSVNLP